MQQGMEEGCVLRQLTLWQLELHLRPEALRREKSTMSDGLFREVARDKTEKQSGSEIVCLAMGLGL